MHLIQDRSLKEWIQTYKAHKLMEESFGPVLEDLRLVTAGRSHGSHAEMNAIKKEIVSILIEREVNRMNTPTEEQKPEK